MAGTPREHPARALVGNLTGAPLSVVLVLLAFVMINVLSARHYHRFDWTRSRLFTLSPQSRQIARSLRGPTDLYVLLGQNEAQYSDVTELAQRYAGESSLVHVHIIDPDRQRDRFLDLTQRLGIHVGHTTETDVASEAAIVLVRADRHWEIPREKLAGLGDDSAGDEGASERTATAQVTVERAISEGLLHVDRNDSTKVCVASGHGELTLEGGDSSISQLETELRHSNVTMQSVPIGGTVNIPPDCDALVVAGPRQAFSAGDADILTRYVHSGGNLLLLLDPLFLEGRHAPTGLESVAALGGIELTRTIVIEPDPAHQIPEYLPATFLATEFGEHPITRALRGSDARVLVATARALRRTPGSSVIPVSLMRTTNTAWGETSTADAIRDGALTRDGNDLEGPVHLAMAAQSAGVHAAAGRSRAAAGRLVVVGYSHLASNEALSLGFQARFANGFLVVSSLGWLTDRRELVEIPARPATAAALTVTRQDVRHIQIYTVLLVPLAAALVGIAVWRARKAQ